MNVMILSLLVVCAILAFKPVRIMVLSLASSSLPPLTLTTFVILLQGNMPWKYGNYSMALVVDMAAHMKPD